MAKIPNPKGVSISFTFQIFFSFFLKGLIQNRSEKNGLSLKMCNIGQIRPKVLSQRELNFIHIYFFLSSCTAQNHVL